MQDATIEMDTIDVVEHLPWTIDSLHFERTTLFDTNNVYFDAQNNNNYNRLDTKTRDNQTINKIIYEILV